MTGMERLGLHVDISTIILAIVLIFFLWKNGLINFARKSSGVTKGNPNGGGTVTLPLLQQNLTSQLVEIRTKLGACESINEKLYEMHDHPRTGNRPGYVWWTDEVVEKQDILIGKFDELLKKIDLLTKVVREK